MSAARNYKARRQPGFGEYDSTHDLDPTLAPAVPQHADANAPDEVTIARLRKLEQTITESESTGLEARWLCGTELLALRVGAKLPPGILDELAALIGASRWELQKRMQFAERYPTKEQLRDVITQCRSWNQVVHCALADTPQAKPAAKDTDSLWLWPYHVWTQAPGAGWISAASCASRSDAEQIAASAGDGGTVEICDGDSTPEGYSAPDSPDAERIIDRVVAAVRRGHAQCSEKDQPHFVRAVGEVLAELGFATETHTVH